jgi:NAD(P)-dependent dehydrogenase (short-subunit alcohol dehydrogenase family)
MSKRLQDKVAVITGGTTGIGLATAKLFLAEGAKVIVTGRNPETLAAAKVELPGAEVIAADVADISATKVAIDQVGKRYGRIDVLFLNAGIAQFAPLEAVTEEFFDNQLNINLKGAFFSLQAAQPYLSKGASVIANATIIAGRGSANASVYAASKAALVGVFKSLVAEESFQAKGIRLNIVSPGPIETPIYGKLGFPIEAVTGFKDSLAQRAPLKRFGNAHEVATAVLFLASDESSFVNGTEILIDGGISATVG